MYKWFGILICIMTSINCSECISNMSTSNHQIIKNSLNIKYFIKNDIIRCRMDSKCDDLTETSYNLIWFCKLGKLKIHHKTFLRYFLFCRIQYLGCRMVV